MRMMKEWLDRRRQRRRSKMLKPTLDLLSDPEAVKRIAANAAKRARVRRPRANEGCERILIVRPVRVSELTDEEIAAICVLTKRGLVRAAESECSASTPAIAP